VIILVGGAVASSGESVRGVARFGARAEQPVYHAPPSYYEPPDPDWPRTQSVPPPR